MSPRGGPGDDDGTLAAACAAEEGAPEAAGGVSPGADQGGEAAQHIRERGGHGTPAVSATSSGAQDASDNDLELAPLAGDAGEEKKIRLPKKLRRLYSIWPSQNSFFCRGFLMTGGSDECWAPNVCVWTCILVPCSVYFFLVFPALVRRGAWALPCATLVVFGVTTCSLLATCCSDPGILPRREVILATGSAARLEAALGYDVLGSGDGRVPQHLRGERYRWCSTCRIIRPPRASHCADCDNCVLRYDHHCPFVNNCVGQRNYLFFFTFVTSVMVLALMVIPAIMTYFSARDLEHSLSGMIRVSSMMWVIFYVVVAFGVLIVLAAVLSALLWAYHLYLITANKTTKEYRKSVPNVTEEPTLCAPRGPRLFNPRSLVDPLDLHRYGRNNTRATPYGHHSEAPACDDV